MEEKENSRVELLYNKRSVHYLRVGKATVLPLVLHLNDQFSNFSSLHFQVSEIIRCNCKELLSVLREILPLRFGLLDLEGDGIRKHFEYETPDIYRGFHC